MLHWNRCYCHRQNGCFFFFLKTAICDFNIFKIENKFATTAFIFIFQQSLSTSKFQRYYADCQYLIWSSVTFINAHAFLCSAYTFVVVFASVLWKLASAKSFVFWTRLPGRCSNNKLNKICLNTACQYDWLLCTVIFHSTLI